MNLRLYTLAILISAMPKLALAGSDVSFTKSDFIAAEAVSPLGETLIKVRLSKSGKAKMKKLNASSVGKEVDFDVAGVRSHFTLREPVKGDNVQIGPVSHDEAEKVVDEINP